MFTKIKDTIKSLILKRAKDKIASKLDLLRINNYTINDDLSVDVNDVVVLAHHDLTEIPVKFNRVTKSFLCQHNKLKTLKNAPQYVGGDFNCSSNQIKELTHSPKIVKGHFSCSKNKIENFKGIADEIGGRLDATSNKINTLDNFPKKVKMSVFLADNIVQTLDTITECEAPPSIHVVDPDKSNQFFCIRYKKEEIELAIKDNKIKNLKEELESTLKETNKTKKKIKI